MKSTTADQAAQTTGLDNMTITSPIDGTVVEKHADVGEMIGPAAAVAIFDLADFSTNAAELDVPENKLSLVTVGGPAEIMLDAFPDKRFRGAVLEIGQKVDRAKATVKVKVRFVDTATGALPDMSARVNFLAKELDPKSMKEPPKLVVPATALIDKNGGKAVYVVKDGAASLVPVTIGEKLGGGFVLTQGPAAGTKVVSNPPPDLRDGQDIKVKVE